MPIEPEDNNQQPINSQPMNSQPINPGVSQSQGNSTDPISPTNSPPTPPKKKFPVWATILIIVVVIIIAIIVIVAYVAVKTLNSLSVNKNGIINDSDRRANVALIASRIKLYYLDNQAYPTNTSALVPKYLDVLPVDPTNSGEYKYTIILSNNSFCVSTKAETQNNTWYVADNLSPTPTNKNSACK